MSILYPINDVNDIHWRAVYNRMDPKYNRALEDEHHVELYISRVNSLVKGKLIKNPDSEVHTLWLKGIEFETEEDLVIFKLTFN